MRKTIIAIIRKAAIQMATMAATGKLPALSVFSVGCVVGAFVLPDGRTAVTELSVGADEELAAVERLLEVGLTCVDAPEKAWEEVVLVGTVRLDADRDVVVVVVAVLDA